MIALRWRVASKPINDGRIKTRRGAGVPALVGLLTLAAALGGCTALQRAPSEAPNLHLLAAKPMAPTAHPQRDLVLEVSAPSSWPGFDTSAMAYVQRPYELNYFAANRWADTPARMLGPLLAQALEQSGGFKAVVRTPTGVRPDLRLDTEVVRLVQDFTARPSSAEFVLRIQLIDIRGKRVVATKLLVESEPAPTDNPDGGVTATNVALQRLLQQTVAFCNEESGQR